ncbi:LacI family DNA-binding transcriptional regulator [Foetidibacter luteolus]|uniref:LacI family DNA-binding transcriptional regulator n=1 Tax=Foetidibacter luteolus TaxID=2608880 RepID=UPI00129B294A|nr:LacI family DNA-binding transcriptional regulator [Foetidibacter luteolus]
MSYKVTISDIAQALNTTPATVSRALSNHPAISDDTKQKVAAMAERLNYKPNKIASSLRSGRSHAIGVMIPSAEINFFGSVVHGIENVANSAGYNVLIYQTNELRQFEVKGIETFLSARVDGILASIAKETSDYTHFLEIKKRGVPVVFFDRANDDLGISSVVVDDYRGGYIATEHLLKQGYKRVAHISGPQHIKIFNDRLKGYMGALQAHGIKVDFDLIYTGNVSIEAGKSAIEHLLELPEKPDAVFAVEDFTALGAIKCLKERNIKIPDEFGVIGFANELFGEHITPSLSTIDQQTVSMGKASLELLLQLIRHKDKNSQPRKVVLDPLPVFRQSTFRK